MVIVSLSYYFVPYLRDCAGSGTHDSKEGVSPILTHAEKTAYQTINNYVFVVNYDYQNPESLSPLKNNR